MVDMLAFVGTRIREATTMAKNPQTRFPSVSMVGNMAMVRMGRMSRVASPAWERVRVRAERANLGRPISQNRASTVVPARTRPPTAA